MNSNRSNRSNNTYGTVSHSNYTTLRTPWAVAEESSPRSDGAYRHNNNINNNTRVTAAPALSTRNYNPSSRENVTIRNTNRPIHNTGRPAANVGNTNRNITSRGNARDRGKGNIRKRYGRRAAAWSFDRDLEYWLNYYPSTPQGGVDVHTRRERDRRSEYELEERKMAMDDRLRSEVSPYVPMDKDVLTVKECDLHMYENTKQHQTSQYECTERDTEPQLVVRRGQLFTLTFTFHRPLNPDRDDLFLEFTVGENPSQEDGTSVQVQVLEEASTTSRRFYLEEGWGCKVVGQSGNNFSVVVFIPANAIVGEWKCGVITGSVDGEEMFEYEGVGEIRVLFNPWCRDDQVFYTDDPDDLKEYVLNEYGCIFEGNSEYISRRPWFYGQFQNGILDVCMTIMRLSHNMKINRNCSDVVSMLRNISHVINCSSTAPGIMIGSWSGNYSDGTRPSSWSGSVKILKQLARTKRPVKYAQCFVFSHVFTTVCRALGIPCRSITNFESAHDTDKTATIDSYEDEDGNDLSQYKSDSIWNYHCWNDVWINRPDLDLTPSARGQHSGWHAVDSTPQEMSDGKYQCGPSPLTAIKNGEISVGYDTQFIYGEVNAEMCTWMVPRDSDRGLKIIERKPNAVGFCISTKIPDGKPARGIFNPGHREVNTKRLDITDQYKYPEGSREERESLRMAIGDSFGARIYQESGGLTLDIAKPPSAMIGSDVEMKVYVTNKGGEAKDFSITLTALPIDYTGNRLSWDNVASEKIEKITLLPNTREVFLLPVPEKRYLRYCDSSMSMMLKAMAKVKGEEKPLTKLQKVTLRCPELTVTVPMSTKVKREQPFTVSILVTNTTSRPMTSCSLHLGGTIIPLVTQGFTESDGTYEKKIKEIYPNEVRTLTVEVQAQRLPLSNNVRELDVDVESSELPNMTGSLDMTVL